MERRLFEEAVVPSGRGRGTLRAGILPLSLLLHSVVLGLVLLVPLLATAELPPMTTHCEIMVPGVLPPPPPPPLGRPPSAVVRSSKPAVAPLPPAADALVSLPSSWSELPPADEAGWGFDHLPVCEGCVPWGDDDGVPGLEVIPASTAPPAPVVRPSWGIEPPLKMRHVVPEYPKLAREAGVQGVVIIECRVDIEGRVVDARVLRGHLLLNDAALEAVRQWRYRPTLLNGQRVSVLMTVTVHFRLRP
jgi:protein TonB